MNTNYPTIRRAHHRLLLNQLVRNELAPVRSTGGHGAFHFAAGLFLVVDRACMSLAELMFV